VIDRDVVPLALGASEHGRVRAAFVAPDLDAELAFVVIGDGLRRLSLPLRFVWDAAVREDAIARARSGPREGWIIDAAGDASSALLVEAAMREGLELSDDGRMVFAREGALPPGASSQRIGTSSGAQRWVIDDARLVTLHREMPRLGDSAVAFLRHLRERAFAAAPDLHGTATIVDPDGETWVAATSQRFIPHPIDADGALRALLAAGTADERLLRSATAVADGLAALHRALAEPGSDPTFGTHALGADDLARWRDAAHADLDALVAAGIEGVVAVRDRVAAAIDALPAHIDALSSRAHGRLTLRRILLVDGAPVFVGFGEPVVDRTSPLADIASLARSFERTTRESIVAVAHDPTSDTGEVGGTMRELTASAFDAFLARYVERTHDLATVPRDPQQRDAMLRFFRVRSALRDVRTALARRPALLAEAVDALRAECP